VGAMSNVKSIQKSDRADIQIDTQTTARVVESLVLRGDISALNPEERSRFYLQICESLGLTPAALPFAILRLNGKEILYPTRGATDQLAAIHRLNREIVDGPRVVDLAGTKLLYAVCRATHPNGRTETAVATVALSDPLNAMMKVECVPLGSEILTRRGFKRHDQLMIGEAVLAYDVNTGRSEWVPLENVSVYENAKVFKLSTEKNLFSVRCTEDHSWAVGTEPYKPCRGAAAPRGPRKDRGPERKLVKANEIRTSHRLIVAAPAEGGSHPLTPELAAVLGWVMTDGTIQRRGTFVRLGICQSKPRRVAEIRELLARAGLHAREDVGQPTVRVFPGGASYECLPQHWFYLSADESRFVLMSAGIEGPADMPVLVTQLSAEARAAMFSAMMAADADSKGRFGKKRKPGVMEAWAILATLEGIALGKPGMSSTGEVPTQQTLDCAYVRGSNLSLTPDGEEPVWCPTTKHGTWVMRQNGRITITGNTKAKRRATLSILGLGMLDESELDTIPAHLKSAGAPIKITQKPDEVFVEPDPPSETEISPTLASFYADVEQVELPGETVALWIKHRAELSALSTADREAAWKVLCKRCEDVGKMKNAKAWLKRAIAEEDARVGSHDPFNHATTTAQPPVARDDIAPEEVHTLVITGLGDSDAPALDALREDLEPLKLIDTKLLQAARVWRVHKDAVGEEAGGLDTYIYRAQKLVLDVTKASATRNQLNEHVQAIETRETSRDNVFTDVMDLLELADSAEDVAEIVRKHKPAIDLRAEEVRELLRNVAVRRVQELVPGMADAKQASRWLKNALAPKDPEPPSGGPKPNGTPANDSADPERAAIEQADSMPPAQALRTRLAECKVTKHLYNTLFKYGPDLVTKEQAAQICAERMVETGAHMVSALKAVREEIDRRGWKRSRRAA